MRQELRWTLGGTLLLSAAALWWPQSAPKVVGAVDVTPGDAGRRTAGLPAAPPVVVPLPRTLESLHLEPAQRDAFAAAAPAASAVAVAPAPPPKPLPAPAPAVAEPPIAPPLTLRYLGRMVTPEGRPVVLLARGDAPVTVQPGMMLDEGFRVLRVTSEAVRLVYPPTGGEVDIPIPPAPNNP